MKTIALSFLITLSALANNILIIGDSHMAGIFGKELYKNFSRTQHNTVVLGHASSAPIQWIGVNNSKLSGGVFNKAFIDRKHFVNPNPTHWRTKVAVPHIAPLLADIRYHKNWQNNTSSTKPDTVVIELGANDARAIADRDGNIYQRNYDNRLSYMKRLIAMVVANNSKCIFVTPPNGKAKSAKRVKVLYEMIYKAANGSCAIYDQSIKFVASGKETSPRCDGYHFGCTQADKEKAQKWAKEVFDFISKEIL